MKHGVAILAYNRPKYLSECLSGLSGQVTTDRVTVFVDGPACPLVEACHNLVDEHGFHIKTNPSNVGSPGQWQTALDHFTRLGCDAITVLSDDVVPAPRFIEASLSMFEAYPEPQIMMVSPFPDKEPNAWPPMPWQVGCHILGVTFKANAWIQIRDSYIQWRQGQIRLQVADFGPNPKRGEDVALYTLGAELGMTGIYSQHRQATYIGVEGAGSDQALFDKQGWATLKTHEHFNHPPMNQWWLELAIKKMQHEYGKPIRA